MVNYEYGLSPESMFIRKSKSKYSLYTIQIVDPENVNLILEGF